MNKLTIAYGIVNILFALAISPFLTGVIKKTKAFCQGRKGPAFLQQYYNLAKLFKKEGVVSSTASWITKIVPYINISALVTAALFVPLLFLPDGQTVFGNLILFLYLLALAKFFMALAGLDAGSTFGGMGSSREMSLSAVVEPVIFLVFLALTYVFKTLNLFEIIRITSSSSIFSVDPTLILLVFSLFIVLIAETARVPVDNPETHLELTMIHEGMLLEQSGGNLAMMEISHSIKQTLLMAIIINIFLPVGFALKLTPISLIVAAFSFFLKAVVLAVCVGFFESSIAKLRLFRLPTFFMIPFFLSFLTLLIEVFK